MGTAPFADVEGALELDNQDLSIEPGSARIGAELVKLSNDSVSLE